MKSQRATFWKIVPSRRDYLGERYFRVHPEHENVVQVCLRNGDVRKGKSNSLGIHIIQRLTFEMNYNATGYVERCTEKEYYKQFDRIVDAMRVKPKK